MNTKRELTAEELITVLRELDLEEMEIMKELQTPEETPEKEEEQVNQEYLDDIRHKLYDFYVIKREVPTLKSLLRALKRDMNFKGTTKTLRKMLRQDGFRLGTRERRKRTSKDKCCCCTVKAERKDDDEGL